MACFEWLGNFCRILNEKSAWLVCRRVQREQKSGELKVWIVERKTQCTYSSSGKKGAGEEEDNKAKKKKKNLGNQSIFTRTYLPLPIPLVGFLAIKLCDQP